jgi:hypothetical protein
MMADVLIDISTEGVESGCEVVDGNGLSDTILAFGSVKVNFSNEQFQVLLETLRPWMPDFPATPCPTEAK